MASCIGNMKKMAGFSASLTALAWASAAYAQSAPDSERGASRYEQEIIVTARQRAESLADVPATIQAFTADEIKSANITRPADFITLTPGLSQVQTLEVGDMQVNIRGINSGRDTESSVALIIDGVLITNPNAINQELDNITQIEVLKGPQGALYGRNALAGAIIMTTRKPTDEFEGYVKAGVGRHNLMTFSGGLSGPLSEAIKASISAYHRREDGFAYNSFRKCGDCETYSKETGVTGRMIITPSDRLEFDFKARYSKVKAGGGVFNASLALKDAAIFLNIPGFWEDPNDHDFVYISRNKPVNEQESLNFSLKAVYDVGIGELTATATYNDVKNYFIIAGTSNAFGIYNASPVCQAEYYNALNTGSAPVPPPFFYAPDIANSFLPPYPPIACGGNQYQQRDQKDASIEVRLTSRADQDLRWMIGGYFADIKRHLVVAYGGDLGTGTFQKGFVPSSGPNPTDLLYDDDLYSKVYAAFANVAYDVQDNLEVALALRYDIEKRRVSNNVPKVGPQTPGFGAFGIPVCPQGPENCTYYINPFYNLNPTLNSIPSRSETFRQLQPKATINWKPSAQLAFFASYGYGFRSGGFNSSGTTATLTQFFGNLTLDDGTPNLNALSDTFKKEVSKAAELGFKAKLFDSALSLNGAVYLTRGKNMQDFSFFAGPFGSFRVVTNIDKAELKGFELDFRLRATSNLSIFGGIGVTDSEIKKYSTRPYTVGNKMPYVPSYNGNIGVEYRLPLGTSGLELVSRVDEAFTGKTWFSPVQKNYLPNFFTGAGFGGGDFSKQYRKPYAITNVNVTLESESWDISVWANNLFDKNFLAEIIPAPEFGGSFIHDSYGRTYGLKASYRF